MKRKPSRIFIYLSLMMVFLLVAGLIVVGMLVASNRSLSQFELTSETLLRINPTTAFYVLQTETAKAAQKTQVTQASFSTVTP